MKYLFLGTIFFLLTSCSSTEKTTKDKNWEPLFENSTVKADLKHKFHPREMKLNNGMLLRQQEWDSFLKDFVLSFEQNKRDTILLGLSRFYKQYDKVDKLIKFEPLRYLSGPYSSTSYISLVGAIDNHDVKALVKLKYYGQKWLFANSVKIVADDYTWESGPIEFKRDNNSAVWEYAFLNYDNEEVQKLLRNIVESEETIIRFNGKDYYKDFIVPERMKTDLRAMIAAIEKIEE